MKKILYLLAVTLFLNLPSMAQEGEGRIRQKLSEYIQQKLNLTKSESDRFEPVFMEYFNELRKTNQQNRGDRLVLQQKIAELRLRYRDQFKPIIGEKKSNDVFAYEREFIREANDLRKERMQNRKDGRPNKN